MARSEFAKSKGGCWRRLCHSGGKAFRLQACEPPHLLHDPFSFGLFAYSASEGDFYSVAEGEFDVVVRSAGRSALLGTDFVVNGSDLLERDLVRFPAAQPAGLHSHAGAPDHNSRGAQPLLNGAIEENQREQAEKYGKDNRCVVNHGVGDDATDCPGRRHRTGELLVALQKNRTRSHRHSGVLRRS